MIIVDDLLINKNNASKNAGSKARNDIIEIFDQAILLPVLIDGESKIINYIKFLYKIRKIKKNDIVLLQYPLYGINKFVESIIYKKVSQKKSVLLIHDINSLRYTPNNEKKIHEEIEKINMFDVVISHNEKMTKWLKIKGTQSKIINLEIFDYLGDLKSCSEKKYDIAYAGNLLFEKSQFLYKMVQQNTTVNFEFFGVGFNEDKMKSTNYVYNGSKNPDELLGCFQAKFGLIWDGDSIDKCNNIFGDYLKYNNPHKLSLYISANLPVIAWNKSAIADFVKINNVGIVVDNLKNMQEILNDISDEKYNEMVNNVRKISDNLKQGYYTKKAIKNAKEYLENEI